MPTEFGIYDGEAVKVAVVSGDLSVGSIDVSATTAASGVSRLLTAAASVNETIACSGPCTLISIKGRVERATPVYLKLYDSLDGADELDTPVETIYLPGS